jgi:hypothetical protein
MGETTSTWKDPLHSSDSEHHWMKIRESKGKGGPLRFDRTGGQSFPEDADDADGPGTNASSVLTNPFDKHSS